MGQEAEAEQRRADFAPYQINARVVSGAAPEVIVMHCLPAHRGEEITADVVDGPQDLCVDGRDAWMGSCRPNAEPTTM